MWIPRTPWEAMWYSIVQWAGITDDALINYVLPNAVNFGCDLYAEADLYEDGAATLSGCGGIVIELEQSFIVSEPRKLTPEEQRAFCGKVAESVGSINIRCVILNQILSEIAGDDRRLAGDAATYKVVIEYIITTEETDENVEGVLVSTVNSPEFQAGAVGAVQMDADIQAAVVVTSSPSESPSLSPTESVDIRTIVTPTIFNSLSPNLAYTYEGFCTAVDNWNINYPDKNIFVSRQQVDLNELAAFFGHVLHESDELQATREYAQCQDSTTSNGQVFCKPSGYEGGDYTDPYCSSDHTTATEPFGCDCPVVSESSEVPLYINANDLYFGRGPLQLSHNYNYYHFDADADEVNDLCSYPDLIATNEAVGWASAFWFWTSSIGSDGKTCAQYVQEGSFGGTLDTVNGAFECPQSSYTSDYEASVISRLDKYCSAATAFEVEGLLAMNHCNLLQDTFHSCVSATSPALSCEECQVWQGITFPPSPCKFAYCEYYVILLIFPIAFS